MASEWTSTALWQQLEQKGPAAEVTRHYLRSWLNDVQMLLAKGGTAPLDFTLHDDEHSYRVAERMAEIIPAATLAKLSDFEIGLLLLSAYLHDIGMNPRRQVVRDVRDFLLSGVPGSLEEIEVELLQRWLDETRPGTQPPVSPGASEIERLFDAETLTAYYCRYRHNDWSEKFILERVSNFDQSPYPIWIHDLISLCKSHHYGLQVLMGEQFNLRIAGAGNKLVNLRYLAAVLRIADILEFDPERTPDVVFRHRSIHPSSQIYWYKDHNIVLALNERAREVLITARTSNAWAHRAVLDTADAVDGELQTCARINDQNGFVRGIRLDNVDHYNWPWARIVTRDIAPQPHSFEYIDGAFRPDARRVLSLLAGTQLYQTPLAAVRELLQNAFDAVREQIALELLQIPAPMCEGFEESQGQFHLVALNVEEREGGLWLTCSDTGVGMTRRVIETHLLVTGSKPRPELLELKRQCSQRNLEFGRSGEFGIGVLSYFMLADKLVIETRSGAEAYADQETHGWRFETDGLDAVGELRSLRSLRRGTTIKLRLTEGAKKDMLGPGGNAVSVRY